LLHGPTTGQKFSCPQHAGLFTPVYTFSSGTLYPYIIQPWLKITLYCGNSLALCFALSLAAFYYSSAATSAESNLEQEKAKLEELTVLLRKMFGRYLSVEVMNSLMENPSALELGAQEPKPHSFDLELGVRMAICAISWMCLIFSKR
jgi:hypothetical protein